MSQCTEISVYIYIYGCIVDLLRNIKIIDIFSTLTSLPVKTTLVDCRSTREVRVSYKCTSTVDIVSMIRTSHVLRETNKNYERLTFHLFVAIYETCALSKSLYLRRGLANFP